MNTRRITTRRVEEIEKQEEIPPKVEQEPQSAQGDEVPILGVGDYVIKSSNRDIRDALLSLSLARFTLVN